MKKQFLIIFTAIFLIVILTSSCSLLLNMQNQALSQADDITGEQEKTEKPEEEKPALEENEEAEANEPEEDPASYSFVGRVDGISSEPEPEHEEEDLEVANSDELDGYIPELTIETRGVNMESVAAHYGYVLALITDDRLLGIIENGNLESIDEQFISNYAARAREGHLTPELRPMVEKISDHLNKRVRAVYLVPNDVEQQFIQKQMDAIDKKGLSPQDVQLVRARYRQDYSVEILEVL